jgi:hypothetical protein
MMMTGTQNLRTWVGYRADALGPSFGMICPWVEERSFIPDLHLEGC